MRKKFLSAVSVFMATVMLAGCGAKTNNEVQTTAASTQTR